MKSIFENFTFDSRPTAKISRLVFISDKRRYVRITRTKIKNTEAFSQIVDKLEEWENPEGFQYIHSNEPETKLNYEIYQEDMDKLNLLYEGKLKHIPFKYLFRQLLNDIESK